MVGRTHSKASEPRVRLAREIYDSLAPTDFPDSQRDASRYRAFLETVREGRVTSIHAFEMLERVWWLEGMKRGWFKQPDEEERADAGDQQVTASDELFVDEPVAVPLWAVSVLAMCWQNYRNEEPNMAVAFNMASTRRGARGKLPLAVAERTERELAAQVYDAACRSAGTGGGITAAVQAVAAQRRVPEKRIWAIWSKHKAFLEEKFGAL